MSELLDNSRERKNKLKKLILKLHSGEPEDTVRQELIESLKGVPYGDVVEVEQELISEGLPESEILKLCDIHSAVLHGNVDLSGSKLIPPGHPVDIMTKENQELKTIAALIAKKIENPDKITVSNLSKIILDLRGLFNSLFDVDKHYRRKEFLLFPYLEKLGITGPPKVMWGKHDEIRELIKGSIELLQTPGMTAEELSASSEIVLMPAVKGVLDMIPKEEEILFPMALDKLTEAEWYEISRHSIEIGYCLYDPPFEWKPVWVEEKGVNEAQKSGSHVQLPSGGFSAEELLAILNTLPVDITFVDRNDKVKYFSQGSERIFHRSRAILNRDVRHCHPPASAHIVDKIVEDFRSGRQNRAPFWINKGGQMVHIEYFALKNEAGEYLGTLEVSQNITTYRELEGEQRILSYK